MSDEEKFLDDEAVSSEDAGPKKKLGALPGLVLKILKWAAIGIGAVIFIVTVVVITFSILDSGRETQMYSGLSEKYETKLPTMEYFNNIPEIRTKTSDKTNYMVTVSIQLGYSSTKYKSLQTELISRTGQLTDLVRSYFARKLAKDLRDESQIKAELKNIVNDSVLANGRIDDIIFLKFMIYEY